MEPAHEMPARLRRRSARRACAGEGAIADSSAHYPSCSGLRRRGAGVARARRDVAGRARRSTAAHPEPDALLAFVDAPATLAAADRAASRASPRGMSRRAPTRSGRSAGSMPRIRSRGVEPRALAVADARAPRTTCPTAGGSARRWSGIRRSPTRCSRVAARFRSLRDQLPPRSPQKTRRRRRPPRRDAPATSAASAPPAPCRARRGAKTRTRRVRRRSGRSRGAERVAAASATAGAGCGGAPQATDGGEDGAGAARRWRRSATPSDARSGEHGSRDRRPTRRPARREVASPPRLRRPARRRQLTSRHEPTMVPYAAAARGCRSCASCRPPISPTARSTCGCGAARATSELATARRPTAQTPSRCRYRRTGSCPATMS